MPKRAPHQRVNQRSGVVEYRTPLKIVDAARYVMGGIDLDPASTARYNLLIGATEFFTMKDDALNRPWRGRVWMNHPFGIAERACHPKVTGKPCHKHVCAGRGYHQSKPYPGNAGWINKLEMEFECGNVIEACCITLVSTSEDWFQPLLKRPQCFLYPRTDYLTADGDHLTQSSKGSVVTYYGRYMERFRSTFEHLGTIKVHSQKVRAKD